MDKKEKKEKDYIAEIQSKGMVHILEKIFLNLDSNSTLAVKNTSRVWRKAMRQIDETDNSNTKKLVRHKITMNWTLPPKFEQPKLGEVVILKVLSFIADDKDIAIDANYKLFPTSKNDHRNIIILNSHDLSIKNIVRIYVAKRWVIPVEFGVKLAMDENFLIASTTTNDYCPLDYSMPGCWFEFQIFDRKKNFKMVKFAHEIVSRSFCKSSFGSDLYFRSHLDNGILKVIHHDATEKETSSQEVLEVHMTKWNLLSKTHSIEKISKPCDFMSVPGNRYLVINEIHEIDLFQEGKSISTWKLNQNPIHYPLRVIGLNEEYVALVVYSKRGESNFKVIRLEDGEEVFALNVESKATGGSGRAQIFDNRLAVLHAPRDQELVNGKKALQLHVYDLKSKQLLRNFYKDFEFKDIRRFHLEKTRILLDRDGTLMAAKFDG